MDSNEEVDDGSALFQKRSSDFLSWFTTRSGTRLSTKITLADLRYRGAGRGVLANADISADEELFAIPTALVLQTSSSELYSKIPDLFGGLGPWNSLIVVIIYEYLRHDKSPWFQYLQLLPTRFDTLMFWTSEEIRELQGSAVVHKIGKEAAEQTWSDTILPAMLDHRELFPLPFDNTEARKIRLVQLAHTAGSIIMAYAFDIDTDGLDESDPDAADAHGSDLTEDDEDNAAKGLVPLADMLNADAHRNNARLVHESEWLVMRATTDIKTGDEILNDYGSLPRSDLLRMYGYVSDNYSPFDVVEISANSVVQTAASSEMSRSYLTEKREELAKHGLIEDAFVIGRPEPESELQHLIPMDLRVLMTSFYPPAENFRLLNIPQYVIDSAIATSEASLLRTSITSQLSDYTTSLQEDSEILEKLDGKDGLEVPAGVSPKRYEMAVRVRKGEKEILHQVLRLIQDFMVDNTGQVARDTPKRKREERKLSTRKRMTIN